MNLSATWVAEYHGNNVLAAGPVVAAELRADALPEWAVAERACYALWDQSGLVPTAGHLRPEDADDVMGLLAKAAACWARAALNEIRGDVQHAGARRNGDHQILWLGFHRAGLSRLVLQLALNALMRLMDGEIDPQWLRHELERVWNACKRHHPDFQARILMVAAREMDLPFLSFLPESRCWQFGWGANSQVFFETASNRDGALGWIWQKNKVSSKALMQRMGLPTPRHSLVSKEEDLSAGLEHIGFPCVIKPLDSGGGKGVTANINDLTNLRLAFRRAREISQGPLLLEQHVKGADYRLMVIQGKMVAAIQRRASSVTGDGKHSIRELVARLNADRFQNLVRSRYLRPIPIDDLLRQHLAAQEVHLGEVLAVGRQVSLRSNANRSTGGVCEDVTELVHPQVRAMAEQLAAAVGLDTTGLDYLTEDISQSPDASGGIFIEINATPGMAVFVAAGWSETAIGRLVLGGDLGRIPVRLSVLPSELLAQRIQELRAHHLDDDEGWVCGSELRIGPTALHYCLEQPWGAVQAALRNRHLRQLHIYCTASEIERFGLPVDRFSEIDIQEPRLLEPWCRVIESAHNAGM